MQNLNGKVAFITGGVSGIGLGIAKAFAAAGMKIVISYRRQDHLDSAMEHFSQYPDKTVHAVQLDVTDREAMRRAAEETLDIFGKVHVLCNNAGISIFGPMDEATFDDWDWVMDVNFGGVVNGLVNFLPHIKSHGEGGHVINVASMASFIPGPMAGIYTASKYAVRGLTECLYYSLAPYNIGVSLVCPALTRSNIHESTLNRPEQYASTAYPVDDALRKQIEEIHNIGMDPDEVGQKTLQGMLRNDLYILTHPEFREELTELFNWYVNALPDETPDPKRLEIEALRKKDRDDSLKKRPDYRTWEVPGPDD